MEEVIALLVERHNAAVDEADRHRQTLTYHENLALEAHKALRAAIDIQVLIDNAIHYLREVKS